MGIRKAMSVPKQSGEPPFQTMLPSKIGLMKSRAALALLLAVQALRSRPFKAQQHPHTALCSPLTTPEESREANA